MTEETEGHRTTDAEAQLIRGVLRRDEKAFRQLHGIHGHALYRLALRMTGGRDADAQDAVQEAWRRAVAGLGAFEGRSSLRTWLSGIVVRCALEQSRKRSRHSTDRWETTGAATSAISGRPAAPSHGASASSRGEVGVVQAVDLERAFEALAPGFQAVLVLHDLEGYRHADIAELLQITEGTSKSQLSRARARMRQALGEDYVEE